MDPISNVDRLVLVLRQKLIERSRAKASGSAARGLAREKTASGLDPFHALSAVDDVSDQVLQRTLIQGVLADHFGREMINEPGFQQVVTRVTDALKNDPQLAPLMARVVSDLRAAGR